MRFAVLCPSCRNRVGVQDNLAGQAARCPHCATAFQVPARPPRPAPAPRRTAVPRGEESAAYPEPAPRSRTLLLGLLSTGVVVFLLLLGVVALAAFALRDKLAEGPSPKTSQRRIAKADPPKKQPVAATEKPREAVPLQKAKPLENAPPSIRKPIAPPPLEEAPPEPVRQKPEPPPPPAEKKTDPPAKVESPKPEPPPKNEVARADDAPRFPMRSRRLSGDQIYRRLVKSTVFVRNSEGWGSGSLIHGERKLILTNYHVVGDEKEVSVSFPRYDGDGKLIVEGEFYKRAHKKGEFLRGKVLKVAKGQDLALVQLDKIPEGTPVLKLSAKSASPGETVHSVGNPGASDARWSYTSGTVRQVSHKTWRAKLESTILTFDAEVVETQSPTNPGDSGGPLVNDSLQLVAVTQGANVTARELSLFIDLAEVRKLLKSCGVPLEDVVGPADGPAEGEVEAGDVFALVKLLRDKDVKNRIEAARRLGALGAAARPAARALKRALKDEEPWVRRNAAAALGKLGPDAAELVRKEVFDTVQDADADVRLAAVEALGNLGPPSQEELPLLLSLFHASVRRRQAKVSLHLARSLASLGSEAKDAVPDLRKMLAFEQREARLQAMQTLRKIGRESRKAAPELLELLKDADKSLRLQAAFALVAGDPSLLVEGKDGLSVLVLALRADSPSEIEEARFKARIKEIAAVLVKLGGPAAEGLRKAIGSEFRGGRRDSDAAKVNTAARETAVHVIADIGHDANSPKIMTALVELQRGDPSRAVRDAAKEAFIKLQK